MSFESELVNELERDFRAAVGPTWNTYRRLVASDPSTPRYTGRLSRGVQYRSQTIGFPRAQAELAATARSDDGTDYATIIDQATGKTIRPSRKKALANPPGWGPFGSAKQSTKHVGWWEKANSEANFKKALDEFARFNL